MTYRFRNMLFTAAFSVATVLIMAPVPIVILFGQRATIGWLHNWAAAQALLMRIILDIGVELVGTRPAGPVLYAVKHQTMFEALHLQRLLGAPIPVFKRELLMIPFWGWAIPRYGGIAIDRQSGAIAVRDMIRESRVARDAGRSILIYPEGTRVAPGDQPPLGAGFAALYRGLDLPVVAVATDSGEHLRRSGLGKIRGGNIRIVIGDQIPAGMPRKAIEQAVHAAINSLETQ